MVVSAVVAVAAVGVGYSIYSGEQQKKQQQKQIEMQKEANKQAKQDAQKAEERADIEQNRQNRKKADVAAVQSKEDQAALSGPAGTMLTGNQGVDPDDLKLGGNTLLGS